VTREQGDFDLAEEAMHEAFAAALSRPCARQHEGCILGRHHQHLQAERPFAYRHHGRGV